MPWHVALKEELALKLNLEQGRYVVIRNLVVSFARGCRLRGRRACSSCYSVVLLASGSVTKATGDVTLQRFYNRDGMVSCSADK